MNRASQPSTRREHPGAASRLASRATSPAWGALLFALLLVAPALWSPGGLLPDHPARLAPLAHEEPERAALAAAAELRHVDVAPFPLLTDLRVLADATAAGRVPRWDPSLGLGEPTGETQFPWWYPPYALLTWLPPGRAIALWVWLGLAIAALGLDGLLRERGATRAARWVAGIGLVGGGWALWNSAAVSPLHSAAWLPVALLGVERAAHGRRRLTVGLVALGVAGALSAGALGIGALVPLVAGLYALARRVPGALGGIALGVALAAPAWIGAVEAEPTRPTVPPAESALPRPVLLTAFAPGAFGLPTDPFEQGRNPAAWWFCPEPSEAQRGAPGRWSVYAGVGIASLAAAGVVGAPLAALAPLVMLAAAFLYAFGAGPGPWLYRIPGLDSGSPARALAVAWVAWPWLAAVGAGALAGERRRAAALGALSVAFVGGTLGSALARSIEPQLYATGMRERLVDWHGEELAAALFPPQVGEAAAARLGSEGEVLLLVSGAAFACALFALALRRPRPVLVVLPWLALASGEALRLGWRTLAGCPVPGPVAAPSEFLDALDAGGGPGPPRVLRVTPPAAPAAPRQSLVALYGAADLTPWSARSPDSWARLLSRLDGASAAPRPSWNAAPTRLPEPRSLTGLGVDWLVGPAALAQTAPSSPALRSGELCAWRVGEGPSARCRVVGALHGEGDADARTPRSVASGDSAFDAVRLDWSRPTPERFDVDVRGVPGRGGWLVVAEQWHPGWRATVDGEPAKIERAEGALRAVRVPAGESVVRMTFHSSAQDLAIWCALAAACSLGALGMLARRGAPTTEGTA